ncbi:MAG: sensor domain-containing protein [Acidimicrobiales bacterium]
MSQEWSELGLTLVGDREDKPFELSEIWKEVFLGADSDVVEDFLKTSATKNAVVLAAGCDVFEVVKVYGEISPQGNDLQRVSDAVLQAGEPIIVADYGVGAPVVIEGSIVGVVVLLGPEFGEGVDQPEIVVSHIAHLISVLIERETFRVERDIADQQRHDIGERLRALLETDLEGAAFVDAEGFVRFANDRFIEILGKNRGEIMNGAVFDILLPVHRETVSAMLDLSKQGVAERYVGQFHSSDTEVRWLEIEVSPIHDGESGPVGSWVVVADVSDQKKNEEALLASERWFRALVDQSDDYIVVLDIDGTIRYMSPSSERFLGPSMASVPGHNAFTFIHPDDVNQVMAIFADLLQEPGGQRHLSYRSIAPDGLWRYSEVVATNLFNDPDVGGMVVNSRDITARRRFERLVSGQAEVLEMVVNRGSVSDSLAAIAAMVEEALQDSTCQICLVSSETGRLETVAAPSLSSGFCEISDALLNGIDLAGQALAEPILMAQDPLWAKIKVIPGGELFTRCNVVPLGGIGSDSTQGVMFVYRREPFLVLHEDDPQTLDRVRSLSQVVIQRTQAEEALAHQSTHDPLTGLANRILLFEGLEHALARARRKFSMLGVLFLDVDRFKLVNDSLGHAAGDLVLTELAQRLTSAVRPFDVMARFGGDEFVVICEEIGHPAEVTAIAERIADVMRSPMELAGREYFLNVSIGIALDVGGVSGPEALLRDADTAMYRAKDRGGNCYEVFDRTLRRQARERLEMEGGLRRALERDELFVVYQPVVNLPETEVVGYEALVRWAHPDEGLRLPDRFISLAEETGLMSPIGAYVLATSCKQAADWEQQCNGSTPPWVSVNLSPRQLDDSTIVQTVANALEASGLDPSLLCLEITESAAMDESPATVRTLQALHTLGVRLAIDDFGSGYSSLAYLKHMPVDTIKIDRSLIAGLGSDPADAAIVGAVITMAETLGIDVVVEGVETPEQVTELIALSCPLAQGFYFGVPTPSETLFGAPTSSKANKTAESSAD